MKWIINFILIFFIFTNIQASEGHKHGKTKAIFVGTNTAVGKIVHDFHKSLKSGNKKRIIEILDENVLIYEGGSVQRSAKAYTSHHMLSDMKFMSKMTVKVLEQQVFINGDIAISSSRSLIKGIYKKKNIKRQSMETMILKKINGRWKIIRIHWS